jgi:hypothetical protein
MNTPLSKLEFDDLLNAMRKLVNYFDLQNHLMLYDDDFFNRHSKSFIQPSSR